MKHFLSYLHLKLEFAAVNNKYFSYLFIDWLIDWLIDLLICLFIWLFIATLYLFIYLVDYCYVKTITSPFAHLEKLT